MSKSLENNENRDIQIKKKEKKTKDKILSPSPLSLLSN